jgi:IS5 family transposase
LEPTYKQHTAVDDHAGVIVDVHVETGEANEGQQLIAQLERVEANTGTAVRIVTADKSYAHGTNYSHLEKHQVDAIIPPQAIGRRKAGKQHIPASRFKYDPVRQCVICPAGKRLERKAESKHQAGEFSEFTGVYYRARACDCQACPLRERCITAKSNARSILIGKGYEALLRARRRHRRGWDEATRALYNRHRWRVEGVHGNAKTQHGLRRAIRRGMDNVSIQAYLTAAAMNLKKLAAHTPLGGIYKALCGLWNRYHRPPSTANAFCIA